MPLPTCLLQNRLVLTFLNMVSLLKPAYVLLEQVRAGRSCS